MLDSPQPSPPGSLAIVATPIGNLRDITLRALDVLRAADVITAEDTRTSQHLLSAYGIQAKLVALHEHNEMAAAVRVVADLHAGKRVAYISDAGTPGLSDPGARLVQAVRAAGLPVLPVARRQRPGCCPVGLRRGRAIPVPGCPAPQSHGPAQGAGGPG